MTLANIRRFSISVKMTLTLEGIFQLTLVLVAHKLNFRKENSRFGMVKALQ